MVTAMRSLLTPRRSVRGVTLAEGVMVILIGGLLLSVLPGYYTTYIRVWQRETGKLGAVRRADFAVQRMHEDIRTARSAVPSSDGTSLTVALPLQAYDSDLGRMVNMLDGSGSLVDGNIVQYYFTQDPDGTGSSGGAISRRVVRHDATELSDRVVTERIHPELNPRASGGGSLAPIFAYDSTLRVITVTVTAAEPKPSSSTFAVLNTEPQCNRCGADLIRVPTEDNLAGEIQCPECGAEIDPTAAIVTYQTRLALRNQ